VRVTQEILGAYQHVLTGFKIVTGDKGIFDVDVDGTRIYSKHETGRFPDDGEVLAGLEALLPEGTRRYGT